MLIVQNSYLTKHYLLRWLVSQFEGSLWQQWP